MNRHYIILFLLGCMTACATIGLLSCCDDCPTCPMDQPTPPYKGWVYFDQQGDAPDIFRIDTETGEPYDSVPNDPDYSSPGDIAVSPDGRYLAVSYCCNPFPLTITRIYDAQTLALLHTFQTGMNPIFPSRHNIMVGFSYGYVYIYSIPDFEMIFSDSIGLTMFHKLYEKDDLIYSTLIYGGDRTDSVDIFAYDYLQRKIAHKWAIRADDGLRIQPFVLDIHPDGKSIYFLGGDPHSTFAAFYRYDLETQSIAFSFPMYGTFGDVAVRPDGKEVYVTDPGGIFQEWPTPGTIFIFDAYSGEYLDGISLFGYDIPGIPVAGDEIVFTPTGERAFVGVGRADKGPGSILTVDTKERRVIHNAWPDLGHVPYKLALGPKR
jgi:hypothetical protein